MPYSVLRSNHCAIDLTTTVHDRPKRRCVSDLRDVSRTARQRRLERRAQAAGSKSRAVGQGGHASDLKPVNPTQSFTSADSRLSALKDGVVRIAPVKWTEIATPHGRAECSPLNARLRTTLTSSRLACVLVKGCLTNLGQAQRCATIYVIHYRIARATIVIFAIMFGGLAHRRTRCQTAQTATMRSSS